MEAKYKLRQEKTIIEKLEGDDKSNLSFYIRNKTIWVFDKVAKFRSIAKRNQQLE